MNKCLTRIVFCGSACSGKSSILNALKEHLNPAISGDWNVVFIKEAATHILETTDLHPRIDPTLFQTAVSLYQFVHEDYDRCINATKTHNVSISDRGIPDAFIYTDNASSILDQTVEAALSRYDAVIFFLPYFTENNREGNAYRYETTNELSLLHEKTLNVWGKHPNLFIVPSFQTLDDKVDFVIELLNNQILHEEVFTNARH